MKLEILKPLLKSGKSKIVFLVMDGLGGLPREAGGGTELESARTPNLDALAREGICGLHEPVGPGITPGSGPSHLALFGYDPLVYDVGRGVLSALGINFELQDGDVAARGNFCTIDESGLVTDRRAGRISTEKNRELTKILSGIDVEGAKIFVETEKEHRFVLVLRGEGLSGSVADTDPQQTGVKPEEAVATDPAGEKTSRIIRTFLAEARKRLAGHHPANMILLRGLDERPKWPGFRESYGLKAAAIAGYPMYRGLARLLGMDVLETGTSYEDEFATLEKNWDAYDFFYLHVKGTDSSGEDGDFDRKVRIIEEIDGLVPRLTKLSPDVVVVSGDHSTPSVLKAHSWHPVPTLLWARYLRPDHAQAFGERECMKGSLGPRIAATSLMPIALANALRLEKFGA